ncbi:MAG: Holliday junction branch migration protein RuvA [Treponema sp.]|nr:Holliday junction branch migration protein RuvA [Treponema sp.]
MFNSLTGTITEKAPQRLFIQTGGIEWDITIPDTNLDALPPVGEEGKVFVWMQHTDSSMTLFGFATKSDRDLFFDLNKVEGVGPKSAVKIMSAVAREQLIASLDSGDLARLEKIPGLGKKTAQKMLLALKGKLTLDDDASKPNAKRAKAGEFQDVVSALSDMGYDKKKAEETIERLEKELSSDKDFQGKTKEGKEESIFRRAIIELAN